MNDEESDDEGFNEEDIEGVEDEEYDTRKYGIDGKPIDDEDELEDGLDYTDDSYIDPEDEEYIDDDE